MVESQIIMPSLARTCRAQKSVDSLTSTIYDTNVNPLSREEKWGTVSGVCGVIDGYFKGTYGSDFRENTEGAYFS